LRHQFLDGRKRLVDGLDMEVEFVENLCDDSSQLLAKSEE